MNPSLQPFRTHMAKRTHAETINTRMPLRCFSLEACRAAFREALGSEKRQKLCLLWLLSSTVALVPPFRSTLRTQDVGPLQKKRLTCGETLQLPQPGRFANGCSSSGAAPRLIVAPERALTNDVVHDREVVPWKDGEAEADRRRARVRERERVRKSP